MNMTLATQFWLCRLTRVASSFRCLNSLLDPVTAFAMRLRVFSRQEGGLGKTKASLTVRITLRACVL